VPEGKLCLLRKIPSQGEDSCPHSLFLREKSPQHGMCFACGSRLESKRGRGSSMPAEKDTRHLRESQNTSQKGNGKRDTMSLSYRRLPSEGENKKTEGNEGKYGEKKIRAECPVFQLKKVGDRQPQKSRLTELKRFTLCRRQRNEVVNGETFGKQKVSPDDSTSL